MLVALMGATVLLELTHALSPPSYGRWDPMGEGLCRSGTTKGRYTVECGRNDGCSFKECRDYCTDLGSKCSGIEYW